MKTVLFACVHNAGRSQMAAAWFNALADPKKARGISAGTEPGAHVHPEVVEVMKEAGIDLTKEKPKFLSDELARSGDLLVTMGCGETCPVVPGLERIDWPLEDPKGKSVERVREIRDNIRERVARLLAARGWKAQRRVLFLCTGNSARSQMAEALLRHLGRGAFEALSAGTSPRRTVHRLAIATLERHHIPVDGLIPKDVSGFVGKSFDYVITVCDRAFEQCPVFPGAEMIHWSFSDPAAEDETTQQRAFESVFHGLVQRIRLVLVVSERS